MNSTSTTAGGVGGPFVDELHARALGGDLTHDLLEVDQGASESVHRSNNKLVTVSQVPDALSELLSASTRSPRLLFYINPVALPHRLEQASFVLVGGGHSHVRHPLSAWP